MIFVIAMKNHFQITIFAYIIYDCIPQTNFKKRTQSNIDKQHLRNETTNFCDG